MSVEVNPVDYALPSGETDRKKFEDALTEVMNAMRRQQAEGAYITETLQNLQKDYKIPSTELRAICTQRVRDSFKTETQKQEARSELFQALWGTQE